MADLVEDLMQPRAYGKAEGTEVSRVETHISWVFLVEGDVYKVKRPVHFPFLDFRTLEDRRLACEVEVRINTRLAPAVYRGVVPVLRGADGVHRVTGGSGTIVDYAVHMARVPEARRADLRLAEGALSADDVDRLATHLAAFHASAPHDADVAAHGAFESVARSVRQNFDETRAHIGRFLAPAQAEELERELLGFLDAKSELLRRRLAAGRVREGHGDLRLEHVYVQEDGSFIILDGIEFSKPMRCLDVASDIAFLAMDLAWHGRADLAERFLARYARDADDHDLYAVVDFYAGYRAHVRAKIAAYAAASDGPDITGEAHARAEASARRFFLLALSESRPRVLAPVLVAVGGMIASGKSHVAEAIGAALSAPVIEADRTRKAMFGVSPTQPLADASFQGHYTLEATARVYGEMDRRAGVVLASGRPVVVDASFRSRAARASIRAVAEAQGVPFRFVECQAPLDVCRARLKRRETGPSVSDGRLDVLDAFVRAYEPPVEIAGTERLAVDTTRPPEETTETLRRALQAWPTGLVG